MCIISVGAISTRMNSLRTAFQKLVSKASASGASPKPKTPRMREVYRLVAFLYQHVKTCPSLSSYGGQQPTSRYTEKPVLIKVNKGNNAQLERLQSYFELLNNS